MFGKSLLWELVIKNNQGMKKIQMKKFIPVVRVIPKLRDVTVKSISKLSDKTLSKTEAAGNFLTDVADVFLLISQVTREAFSRDFELRSSSASVFRSAINPYRLLQLPEPLWAWYSRFNHALYW